MSTSVDVTGDERVEDEQTWRLEGREAIFYNMACEAKAVNKCENDDHEAV